MIVFAWNGFPQYAARCVGAFAKTTNESVVVVATRPLVPIKGMESVCNCPVHWIDGDGSFDCQVGRGEGIALFTTGWDVPAFNRLRNRVRANGGRTICLVDNNLIPSFGEILKAIRFNLLFRRYYDAFIVPGKSGRKLLRFYGVPDGLIREGSYAADESLFTSGSALAERSKRIIYVGQYIPRKNIEAMAEAFRAENRGDWRLDLYGCGPVAVADGGGVFSHPFLQVEELSEQYRRSRALWLGSHEEHWGVVVHEAALSGCVLALSNRVGAAADLAGKDNAVIFDPESLADMRRAMRMVMDMSDDRLMRARRESLELAGRIGLNTFVEAVKSVL